MRSNGLLFRKTFINLQFLSKFRLLMTETIKKASFWMARLYTRVTKTPTL